MDNNQQNSDNLLNFDENHPEFYKIVQEKSDCESLRLEKIKASVIQLRLEAAELELKSAALYHHGLWYIIEVLKSHTDQRLEQMKNLINETTINSTMSLISSK